MSKPTTQLRNIASLKTLGNIINALQFSRGRFYYNPEDGAISSKEHEIIQAEFCEFLKVISVILSLSRTNICSHISPYLKSPTT